MPSIISTPSCRSCRWWSDRPGAKSAICHAPMPFWSKLRIRTAFDEGQTCPTWEARAAIKQAEEELND